MDKFDAIVLGAGIVGVSAAIHLLRRNRSVLILDRAAPGEGTSYGNAGVIEREGFYPIVFPRSPFELYRIARNTEARLHYNRRFLPRIAPWLLKLRSETGSRGIEAYAEAMNPLLAHAAAEHGSLAGKSRAVEFFRGTGWLKGYRSVASFEAGTRAHLALAEEFGIRYQVLDAHEIVDLEPDIAPVFARAVLWLDTETLSGQSTAALPRRMRGGSNPWAAASRRAMHARCGARTICGSSTAPSARRGRPMSSWRSARGRWTCCRPWATASPSP